VSGSRDQESESAKAWAKVQYHARRAANLEREEAGEQRAGRTKDLLSRAISVAVALAVGWVVATAIGPCNLAGHK
jgi:ribonuclease PH